MQPVEPPAQPEEPPPDEGDQDIMTLDLGTPGARRQTTSQPGTPAHEISGTTQPAPIPQQASPGPTPPGETPSGQGHVTLDVSGVQQPRLELSKYIQEKQQDYVRLIVTIGLLLMFAWVIVWASIESASWKNHWDQTKDMLQIILPALTGLIGSVLGFYFGSRGNSKTN
jgi:hypothetical protein